MIYKGTESNTRPPRVLIENLPGRIKHVRLADNIEELTSEEGATFYRYDESVFTTKDVVTVEEIEANFAEYWEKGKDAKQDDDPDPVTPDLTTVQFCRTNNGSRLDFTYSLTNNTNSDISLQLAKTMANWPRLNAQQP